MLIEWTGNLSVAIGKIDDEHKKLVDLINGLHDAMKSGNTKSRLGWLINELAGYAAVHFATEEKLFDQYGYPSATLHKLEHAKFIRQVTEFKGQFDSGKAMLSMEVMSFLSDWLKNHILKTDKQYGPYLIGKGVK
jgi:hemerythrin-like metal-binding protein